MSVHPLKPRNQKHPSGNKISSLLVNTFLMLILFSAAAASQETPVLTLDAATAAALSDNPGLAQIKARAEALAALPSQAGALPDPMLSFNMLNLPTDSFDTRQEPMTQMQFGLSQSIPFPGKLALRESAASFEAAAAAQDVDEARNLLRQNVRHNWWQLFYTDRALTIIANNRTLLRQFIQIARTKYEVGEGLQQDVLLAQLELSKLLDRSISLEGARSKLEAQLNVLLAVTPERPIKLPEIIDETLPNIMATDALYGLAESGRPLLEGQREAVEAAKARLDLAQRDFLPDFTVGAAYSLRDRTLTGSERADFLSLKLSVTLPLNTSAKQSKAVDQRAGELMQRKYALEDAHNRVRGRIAEAHSDYRRARAQCELFKTGIIPQATQTVTSMLAGYRVSKVDFLNLVRSQITLFDYELQYWQAFTEANQALAQLTAVVGEEDIYE
ncbi:MAG: TolC family protein [Gammaproteobacteria bacterium]